MVYEVYVRSLADSDGDGIGDLPGLRSRLAYLADLGVDALWLTPFYPSPQADHGYDVADYRDVEPTYGTLDDLDAIISDAHAAGLRILVDIVPNHTSTEHAWFRAALASEPGSAERARYIFRPGRGRAGGRPPNGWKSIFGGSAWTRLPDGDWYLHLFDPGQPDLDWSNPAIGDEFESILRFWLDRGVDGFRIDVAHGLVKAPGLPDVRRGEPSPYADQPAVHDVYRRWRRVLDSYPGDRMAVAEAWSRDVEHLGHYTRPDELDQAFDFELQVAPWSAAAFRKAVVASLDMHARVGSSAAWVLSSHDSVRHTTRYGEGEVGTARARAATLLALALPGGCYLFQGEELGLPQVDVPPERRQDPAWHRSGGKAVGRDGCRIPLPWSGTTQPYGFGPGTAETWLPQPAGWGEWSVEAQSGVVGSTLSLYRAALAARRDLLVGSTAPLEWLPSPPGTLAFVRGRLVSATNFSTRRRRIGGQGRVLLTSGPLDEEAQGGPDGSIDVPPATTVWSLLD